MIDIVEYINLILKKKGLTRKEFTNLINNLEDKLGDTRTSTQNITNYLNDKDKVIGYRMALKMEKALDLPDDTLLNMVKSPVARDSVKDFNKLKEKVRKL